MHDYKFASNLVLLRIKKSVLAYSFIRQDLSHSVCSDLIYIYNVQYSIECCFRAWVHTTN